VFVDYAHTPAGLKTVLADLRNLMNGTGRLHVVFGCGGDRDRDKRSVMGDIASQLADFVIVTSDNPRSEDPRVIASAIVSGVGPANAGKVMVELDRQRAIITALKASAREDVVVIAGKGHETGQVIGTTTTAFDDAAVAREALAALRGEA
jgi:UDP-N-acetylmuramoyl-L-alanyl-D-glutamate--2,6-diaminopimelate ligase